MDPEEQIFAKECAELRAWWGTERFRYTERPYSAEEVIALRGTLQPKPTSGFTASAAPRAR